MPNVLMPKTVNVTIKNLKYTRTYLVKSEIGFSQFFCLLIYLFIFYYVYFFVKIVVL